VIRVYVLGVVVLTDKPTSYRCRAAFSHPMFKGFVTSGVRCLLQLKSREWNCGTRLFSEQVEFVACIQLRVERSEPGPIER